MKIEIEIGPEDVRQACEYLSKRSAEIDGRFDKVDWLDHIIASISASVPKGRRTK